MNDRNAIINDAYKKLKVPIYRFTKGIMKDDEEAEDITSEVFVKLMDTRYNFETFVKMRSFAFKCARNKCLNRLLSLKRHTKIHKDIAYLAGDGSYVNENIDETLSKALYKALSTMESKYRVCLYLFYFEKMSHAQIANILHLSTKQVGARIRRCKDLLKVIMRAHSE